MAYTDEYDEPEYEDVPPEERGKVYPPLDEQDARVRETRARYEAECELLEQALAQKYRDLHDAMAEARSMGLLDTHRGGVVGAKHLLSEFSRDVRYERREKGLPVQLTPDELMKQFAEQKLDKVMQVYERLLSSDDEKIAKSAADRIYEMRFGKFGTQPPPVDPNAKKTLILTTLPALPASMTNVGQANPAGAYQQNVEQPTG